MPPAFWWISSKVLLLLTSRHELISDCTLSAQSTVILKAMSTFYSNYDNIDRRDGVVVRASAS